MSLTERLGGTLARRRPDPRSTAHLPLLPLLSTRWRWPLPPKVAGRARGGRGWQCHSRRDVHRQFGRVRCRRGSTGGSAFITGVPSVWCQRDAVLPCCFGAPVDGHRRWHRISLSGMGTRGSDRAAAALQEMIVRAHALATSRARHLLVRFDPSNAALVQI